MDELIDTRKDIEEALRLENAATELATAEEVRQWLERLRDGDLTKPEYIKELIRTFLKAVYVFDDKLTFQFYYGVDRSVKFPDSQAGGVFASTGRGKSV